MAINNLDNRLRLERACDLVEQGQLNLSGAAHYAGIGVEQMMHELTRRGTKHEPSVEQFADGSRGCGLTSRYRYNVYIG